MAYFRCGIGNNKSIEPNSISLNHFEDNIINNQITDAKGIVFTANGSNYSLANDSKFGEHSLYFNGGTWFDSEVLSSLDLRNDFTIDFWVKINTDSRICPLCTPDAGILIDFYNNYARMWVLNQNNKLIVHADSPSGRGQGKKPIIQGEWTHIALIKSGNWISLYINGEIDIFADLANNEIRYVAESAHIRLGCWDMDNNYTYQGYIDEVRVTNVAVWKFVYDNEVPTKPYSK